MVGLVGPDGVAQANLHGDRAHVIIDPDYWTLQHLTEKLAEKGFVVQSSKTDSSSLEDVYTLLTHRGKENLA